MNADEPQGGSRRRSGRRNAEPLQHIGIGGGAGEPRQEPDDDVADLEEDPELDLEAEPRSPGGEADDRNGSRPDGAVHRPRARVVSSRASARRRVSGPRPVGLDRIRPRTGGPTTDRPDAAPGSESSGRDPLGRAALYSSGPSREQPLFGTFIVECSACRRETPVTAGDLIRLGIPSLHFPFVKRFPSLMRCPSCGRRTWLRIRWRI
ncbi:MAG TPA: hypothetical protein VID47_07190 [Actinomycetota bacterium]